MNTPTYISRKTSDINCSLLPEKKNQLGILDCNFSLKVGKC